MKLQSVLIDKGLGCCYRGDNPNLASTTRDEMKNLDKKGLLVPALADSVLRQVHGEKSRRML